MIYNIVKKDFILAKKYLILMLAFAVLAPFFIESKVGFLGGAFLSFFITIFFIQYMLFNTISMSEDKYKGSLYLCTTPYTRKSLVKGKYIFIAITFIFSTLIYIGLASLNFINIPFIDISIALPMIAVKDLGISFLIISILFGTFIPLQYKFGYEKVKYIALFFTFISPYIVPRIVKLIGTNNINSQFNNLYLEVVPFILAFIISIFSMFISIYIYSKKDLN